MDYDFRALEETRPGHVQMGTVHAQDRWRATRANIHTSAC